MSDESDALVVARWCWPAIAWINHCGDLCSADESRFWYFDDWDCIHDAEQIVLARGLAKQYGEALGHALLDTSACLRKNCAGDRWSEWMDVCGEDLASIATAPLPARLRALANVARENPMTPRETPCPFVHGDAMCQCSCGKECGKFSGHCREHGNLVRFGGSPVVRTR